MAELSVADARERVRKAGLRATSPRVAVLRLLASSARPLSHGEVVSLIGSDAWDQATLYRNLQRLVDGGLARVASRANGVSRFEVHNEDDGPHLHPHFSCRGCGQVTCLPDARLTGPVDRRWHAALSDCDLQLTGDCPDCRDRRGQTPTDTRRSEATPPPTRGGAKRAQTPSRARK